MMLKKQRKCAAFTLVELLMALMVAAIVLTAAATMAEAMSRAKEANDQMSRNTAYLLQIQTRLSDLIMRANVVVDGNNQYIILQHKKKDGTSVNTKIKSNDIDGSLEIYEWDVLTESYILAENYTKCQLVKIADMSGGSLSSDTKGVTIQFTLTENETYQVCAALR